MIRTAVGVDGAHSGRDAVEAVTGARERDRRERSTCGRSRTACPPAGDPGDLGRRARRAHHERALQESPGGPLPSRLALRPVREA